VSFNLIEGSFLANVHIKRFRSFFPKVSNHKMLVARF